VVALRDGRLARPDADRLRECSVWLGRGHDRQRRSEGTGGRGRWHSGRTGRPGGSDGEGPGGDGRLTGEVKAQANQQTERLADGLRSFAGQIQALVEGDQANAGPLPDYARQATDQLQQLAGQIGDRGFDGVVDDVQRFARRRPGLFLAGAAAAGFLGGRLLRGAQAASQQPQQAQVGGAHTTGQLPMPGQLAGATADQTDVIVLSESATAPAEGTTGVTSTPVGGAR
jgi:hypothetical protein